MNFFKKGIGLIIGIIMLIAFGAGLVFAVKWYRDKEARDAINAVPAIAENTAALTSEEAVVKARTITHRDAVTDFKTSSTLVLKDPSTSTKAKETIKKGEKAVATGDSVISAKDSVIRLLYRRDTLLTDEAVRARRGKFIQVHAAVGYAPYISAPAARVGVDLQISQHWGATATTDVSMKYRMGSGNPKAEWVRTDFIGVNYRF